MKRALLTLLKGLAGVALLLLAGLALVLAYNQFDEPLTPQAQALIAVRPVAGRAEDNAWFALLGLRAPAGKDALAVGAALDQLYFDAYGATPMRAEPPDEAAVLGGPALKPRRIDALRCNWFENDCVAQFRAQRVAIDAFGAEQAALFERYQRVLALPEFNDRPLQSLNEPAPIISLFVEMDALAQARALYACEQGDAAGALAHVQRVTGSARRAMANTSNLATKIVFSQVLRNNLALLNALLRSCPALAAQPAQALTPLASPLTPAEVGLDKTADAEVRLIARNFMYVDSAYSLALNTDGQTAGARLLGAVANRLYQRQATVNFLASRKPFFSLDSPWMRTQRGQDEKSANPRTDWPSGSLWRDYVDNPVGRVLLAIATPNLGVYTDRMLDVDGYQRLTALHLLILSGKLGDAAIPGFLQAQAARYGDPYLGRPMLWDASQRALRFQGHGRASSSGPPDGSFTILLAPRS